MLIVLVALAGGMVSGLIALYVLDAMGNTYRSIPDDVRRQLRSATLYHYCDAAFVDQYVDAATGTVTLRRRARTKEPYLTGRRALYLYTAHGPRGAKTNHPKRWRGAAAVITVSGADLLDDVGETKLKYRRYDSALAVLGDYYGPGRLAVRSGDAVEVKNHPTAPGHHTGSMSEEC